ncbi:MAG TPA: alginate lyase family protein [Gammaproteobacteria bacterium]|nr:alginate lyase family protein [Gammaproteobacteria bacterium]
MNNYFKKLLRYYYTIKHLRLIQIYGQLIFRFKKTKVDQTRLPLQRRYPSQWMMPILKLSTFIEPNTVVFLNQARDISEKTIWTDLGIDKLWLYHLHYFDVINSSVVPAEPFFYKALIERWIAENPIDEGCGWEPYPISLRVVNWIKWSLAGNQLTTGMLHSLAIQVRYLCKRIEIHLLGNHLLANAKAFIFAGLFFKGKEADAWFRKGLILFRQELSEQILADGGHFELSPMYHSIILEDLLDVINIFKTYEQTLPTEWPQICEKMFFWLENMCHLDNEIAFFNDATLGVAPILHQLRDYLQRLKLLLPDRIAVHHHNNTTMNYLPNSGYCRMQHNKILLLADVANIGAAYQPGHGHADTLSFELSIGKHRLIVNSGISSYLDNDERLRQRGSKAHNTLVVDGLDSSEIWKSFRVARRAKVKNITMGESKDELFLKAMHDGYARLNDIYHHRLWRMHDNELLIEDDVFGSGLHKIELIFHIHPAIKINQLSDRSIIFYNQSNEAVASLEVDAVFRILESTYHPAFNTSISNRKIVVELKRHLPLRLNTFIKAIG